MLKFEIYLYLFVNKIINQFLYLQSFQYYSFLNHLTIIR
jgi:hypothetical protein